VFQVNANYTLLVVFDDLVVSNKTLVLKDARQLLLKLGTGDIHRFVLHGTCIPDPCEHIRNWICHYHSGNLLSDEPSLPAGLGYSWNLPFTSIFPEAYTAHLETAHVATGTPAYSTTIDFAHLELGFPLRLRDH